MMVRLFELANSDVVKFLKVVYADSGEVRRGISMGRKNAGDCS